MYTHIMYMDRQASCLCIMHCIYIGDFNYLSSPLIEATHMTDPGILNMIQHEQLSHAIAHLQPIPDGFTAHLL